ncbi:hypothetical protein BGZ96_006596 [Linnemannia gamsii]|uniref:WD40 repeat-like protein n=1 Tax=Linnemannia gamsii TaxID=64522 RepID=A0ABQ7KFY8_9FUNG|nr:hypothetical protein BGZ96_006596 [Linnemannia gamsii]
MYQRPAVTQRISYVLRKDENRNAHLLGVNALALDTSTLTASPASTAHNHNHNHDHHHHHHTSSKHQLPGGILYTGGRDGMIAAWDLHFEVSRYTWRGPREPQGSAALHISTIFQPSHGLVVSASSDRTVKLVRPHSHNPTSAHIIGTHEDYVKTLAYASGPGWVASGGLDKTVRLWDIKEGRSGQFGALGSIPETSSKASIYALACNPAGTVLATGSPEKIIRVWDPRSGQRITKFAGHTDNIRALLISESGDTILSASSDTTIKLWSLTAQRCITTYTMHSDSVWSLYSDHPQLATFYGGSKDGLVTKTEINRNDDEDPGQCVVICKAETGVARLVAHDNARIWTATSSSSIYQWPDIPPRVSRSTELAAAIVPANLLKMNLNESSFTDSAPEQYYPASTVYSAASLGSIYVNSRGDKQSQHSSEDDEGLIAPIFEDPENVILGEHGLIKHTVLNNRRMVVTEDKCGEIALWDLIKCVQLETFTGRKLEEVVNELNTIESVPSWCTIDTRIGALTVHLDEGRCFDAEVYVDEIEENLDPERPEDQRIVIGKWVLNNLFEQYVPVHIDAYEKEAYRQQHQEELAAQLPVPTTMITNERNEVVNGQDGGKGSDAGSTGAGHLNGSQPTVNTSTEGPKGSPTDPHQAAPNPSTQGPPMSAVGAKLTAPGSSNASPSIPSTPLSSFSPTNSTSSSNSGFMGRLKHSVKKLARTPSAEQRFENGRPVASRKTGNPASINIPTASATPTNAGFKPLNSPSVPEIPAQYATANAGNSTNTASTAPPSTSSSPMTPILEGPGDVNGGVGLGVVGKTEGGDDQSVSISDTTSSHSIDSIPSPVLQLPSSTLSVRPPHPPFNPPTHLDFPKTTIPAHIPVIISEQSREASSTVDLYRGSVGTLSQDYIPLVQVVPTWLLEVVLKNSIPVKESPKVSFVLRPHHHQEGTTTAIVGNAAVGGELGGLLPRLGELPGGNARLTAPRMLRIRKVMAHVVEKLALVPPKRRIETTLAATTAQQPSESDSNTMTGAHESGPSDSTSRILEPVQEEDDGPRHDKGISNAAPTAEGDAQASQAPAKTKEQEEEDEAMRQDSLRPENWLEILCHEQVLSPTMTLATVRTHYWKTGSDVVLSYRYKQRGAGASAVACYPATLSPSAAASFSSSS